MERFFDGRRKIVSITEVLKGPHTGAAGAPLQELFMFHAPPGGQGQGQLVPTGARPQPPLMARFEKMRLALPATLFE